MPRIVKIRPETVGYSKLESAKETQKRIRWPISQAFGIGARYRPIYELGKNVHQLHKITASASLFVFPKRSLSRALISNEGLEDLAVCFTLNEKQRLTDRS